MSGRMTVCGATDRGRKRENNEDAWAVEEHVSAAILADGMGGENCGEVCSAITVESVASYLRMPEDGLPLEDLAKEAIRSANRRALEVTRERAECKGMGSTVVLALWRLPSLVIANVGDSRGYIYRDGRLRQVTYDQNFANELRTNLGLSEERVRTMPHRNVLTMAVGTSEQLLIRTHKEDLLPGDLVLLCSDGLYVPVEDATLASILAEPGNLQEKVERLIACANQNGGPDNVTAVLLEYQEDAND